VLADQQIVLLLDVIHDRFVHPIARDFDGLTIDDPAQRDDGDVGRATSHINNHVAGRLRDRQP
jgi:hypothetical protein